MSPAEGVDQEWSEITVAVAYDDAFYCYFPDALEALERGGATIKDFSPLRDEALPAEADVVYFGCGHPERFAEALAANHCLMMALRNHLCAGRRVYAEGGGLAYLCQQLESAEGEMLPMAGILPAVARRKATVHRPSPAEFQSACETWLAPRGTIVRGYLNNAWELQGVTKARTGCAEGRAASGPPWVRRHQAIGSPLHLNLAAQPALLRGFLAPCPQALAWAGR